MLKQKLLFTVRFFKVESITLSREKKIQKKIKNFT
jgi:hypothetical protein